ncbi:MAG TPA: glycine cleavage system protein T [Parvularcula sp.]|nr:glycine cleavage system protein T [Parvularcula sp.]
MVEGVLTTRAVLSLKGEDAAAFLQGLVTQDVTRAQPVFAALLTPQGKILFDFFLVPADGGHLIDCEANAAPALLKRLVMYKLRAKVAITAEAGLAVHLGPRAGVSFADPRLASLPVRTIAPATSAAPVDGAYDALRLSLGVPEFGHDFKGEEVFLLDVNYDALNAVSYKKGCFVGQEVTSRMKRKGEIRKRTLIAKFAGAPPAKGAAVMADANSVGEFLSGREGGGLALIRIDRLKAAEEGGAPLTVAGREVQIAFPAYLERG